MGSPQARSTPHLHTQCQAMSGYFSKSFRGENELVGWANPIFY